jgi:hypothetical protein
LDSALKIAASFQKEFHVSATTFSPTALQLQTNPADRWNWDYLPLYRSSLLFLPSEPHPNRWARAREWMLEVQSVADNSFEDQPKTEPEPLKFVRPEEAQSFIALWAWQADSDLEKNWYWHIWSKRQYPKERVLGRQGKPLEAIKVIGSRYDLFQFRDEQNFSATVTDFRLLLEQNDFDLSR